MTSTATKMRYCRVEFHGPKSWPAREQHTIAIDFGFFGADQKMESVRALRAQYESYAFVRFCAIETPKSR